MPVDSLKIAKFTPSYVWPNPAFHFRHYFDHPNCRIFLIENITHNWVWLRENAERIQSRDYFVVQLGWYFHDWLIDESCTVIELLGLSRDRFRILFNDPPSQALFESRGFQGAMVSQNAFLDENLFTPSAVPKRYDAVYTARFAPFKRHFLARKVPRLALIAGENYGVSSEDIPAHDYLNEKPLSRDEVVAKVNEARTGLCLSQVEGACYSSSEYLLCGIPVVSTWCHGGRDVWYNDYNSITCDASEEAVAESVAKLGSMGRRPERIRDIHVQQAEGYRRNFINLIAGIFRERGVREDAEAHFRQHFHHKMITSSKPLFDEIFPQDSSGASG